MVELAMQCRSNRSDEELCVFPIRRWVKCLLDRRHDYKVIYCHVKQMVFPTTSVEALRLFSSRSIRVKAAVMLHEAVKGAPYIKLRFRWLGDRFQVYLRNTKRIWAQHNASLKNANGMILKALELSRDTIPDNAIHAGGVTVTEPESEDEE